MNCRFHIEKTGWTSYIW